MKLGMPILFLLLNLLFQNLAMFSHEEDGEQLLTEDLVKSTTRSSLSLSSFCFLTSFTLVVMNYLAFCFLGAGWFIPPQRKQGCTDVATFGCILLGQEDHRFLQLTSSYVSLAVVFSVPTIFHAVSCELWLLCGSRLHSNGFILLTSPPSHWLKLK